MREASTESDAKGLSRTGAIVVVFAIFVVYYVVLQGLTLVGAPFVKALAAPAGAPPLWWRVDKNVLLIGTADLVAGVVPVLLYCLVARRSLSGLGFGRFGTWYAWLLVLVVQALLLLADTRMGALGHAPGATTPYALFASAFIGFAAAFGEETLFRGFMMDTLKRGGYGVIWQVLISMVFFGLAHYSYVSAPYGWTVPVFTGLLGGFWSVVYVLGKRSLWPPIVAHIINDAVLIPSVFYLMAQRLH